MGRLSLAIAGVASITLVACSNPVDVCVGPLPGVENVAIVAMVQDSVSGASRVQGAMLVVREGSYADTARGLVAGQTALRAGYEKLSNGAVGDGRAGTYDVSVSAPGYQLWSRTGVRVDAIRCGVNAVTLVARLKAALP